MPRQQGISHRQLYLREVPIHGHYGRVRLSALPPWHRARQVLQVLGQSHQPELTPGQPSVPKEFFFSYLNHNKKIAKLLRDFNVLVALHCNYSETLYVCQSDYFFVLHLYLNSFCLIQGRFLS